MKISDKRLEQFKKMYGELYTIEVEDKSCLLKKPSRVDYFTIIDEIQKDTISGLEVALSLLWLEGDDEIKNDDSYFIAATTQIEQLFKTLPATVEEMEGKTRIKVEKDGNEIAVHFRRPNRKEFMQISQEFQKSLAFGFGYIIDNLALDLTDEIYKQDDVIISLCTELDKVLKTRSATLKKN